MKKTLLLKFLLLLFTTSSLLAQTNLVENGGFESGTDVAWSYDADGEVVYSLNTDSPHKGTNCLQADVSALGSVDWSNQIKNAFGPVVEGITYEVSIWAKSTIAGSTINFTLGHAVDFTEYSSIGDLELTTEWKKYTILFTSNISAEKDVTLALHITDIATYFFDDFQVVEYVEEITPAIVTSAGNRVNVFLNKNFDFITEADQLPFFVYGPEKEYEVKNVQQSSDAMTLTLVLNEKIEKGESITVEYIPGTLRTSAGVAIEAFAYEAENNSTYVYIPPTDPGTSIDEKLAEENAISVYPTVFTSIVTVKGSDIGLVKIVDVLGNSVYVSQAQDDTISVDLSDLSEGIYFVQAETNDEQVKVCKIVKK